MKIASGLLDIVHTHATALSRRSYILILCFMRKKPTRKQAHLVLPTRKANAEKPKELEFCHRSTENEQ